MALNERFLQRLAEMDAAVRADYTSGKPWKYSNKKKRAATFALARATNRLTNCIDAVQWGLADAGCPASSLHWYGGKGKIVWTRSNGEALAREVFDIIPIKTKTVNQLVKSGKLQPGDILTYMSTAHTNVFYADGTSFDSGAAEGAKFKKWIRGLTHKTYKVGYILRIRDRAGWWVQAGAFKDANEAHKRVQYLNDHGIATIVRNDPDYIRIQAGAYQIRANAERRVAQLAGINVPAIIKEM